jgi:glycosyltransferase involved in cell wall biosynthesis
LQQSLTTLLQQDYSRDRFEVIVVHDGTSEERKRTIQSSASEGRVTVREIIHSPPEGPAARNAAMRMATGEFCAHTDDACRLPLGWIRTIAFAFEESTGVVVGPVVDEPGSYPPFLTLPGSRPGWEHQGLYPITNVAYRRRAALASGGFDGIKGDDDRPPLAWDTELAWRLQRQGWEGRHLKFMFVYRKYTPPKRLGWLRSEWLLAQDLPRVFRNIPELEDKLLKAGGFASVTTFYFDLLLVGLIAAAVFQHWGFLFLALPYALYYSRFIDLWPMSQWKPSVRHVIAAGARHVVWLAGLLWGSLRARRLVL